MWPYPWTHVGTPSHLGHMDRVAATMPSQAHAGAAQEAPDIGQWEGQDVPLVRPSSCNVKGGIPSSRRYLPTYLSHHTHSHPSPLRPGQRETRTVDKRHAYGHHSMLGQNHQVRSAAHETTVQGSECAGRATPGDPPGPRSRREQDAGQMQSTADSHAPRAHASWCPI